MSEPLEDELRTWLEDRGTPDPVVVAAVAGRIDTLPARRGRGPGRHSLPAAVAAVVAVAVVATLVATRFGGPSVGASRPTPPDPAAFAGDPRLDHCGVDVAHAAAIFEMTHLSDYQRHLPNAYPLVGLIADPADPALVVVGSGPSTGERLSVPVVPSPAPTLDPRVHDLCIVPAAAGDWGPIAVIAVDTTGLVAVLPAESPRPSPTPPSPSIDADPTLDPAPAESGGELPPASPLAGDPGFLACPDHALAVSAFQVARARDVRFYLPAFTGREPELATNAAATVVIMGADYQVSPYPGPSGAGPAPTSDASHRSVCIAIDSSDPPTPSIYFVSIAGFDPDPLGLSPTPKPS